MAGINPKTGLWDPFLTGQPGVNAYAAQATPTISPQGQSVVNAYAAQATPTYAYGSGGPSAQELSNMPGGTNWIANNMGNQVDPITGVATSPASHQANPNAPYFNGTQWLNPNPEQSQLNTWMQANPGQSWNAPGNPGAAPINVMQSPMVQSMTAQATPTYAVGTTPTYANDVNSMRQQFAQNLASQQQKALQGVQNIYAGRGTTGSGEEAYAMGQTGQQFGLGAGAGEAAFLNSLSQYGLQQQGQQFNQGLANQQFGLQQGAQEFGQQQTLADLYSQGILKTNPFTVATPTAAYASVQRQQQIDPEWVTARKFGFSSPYEMALLAQIDPERLKKQMNQNIGLNSYIPPASTPDPAWA